MKLSKLIGSRSILLETARLANVGYAYITLKRLAAVVKRGELSGIVQLQQPNEQLELLEAQLTGLTARQSALEEHFSDEDVGEMADAIAFARGVTDLDVTFPIENLRRDYVRPLEIALKMAGITVDERSFKKLSGALQPGVFEKRRSARRGK